MENKIYWFTGQPGAGKTVLSLMLKTVLEMEDKNKVFHIDGDELRKLFNNQKYGREGREENIKRAQDIAKFILAQGYSVVVSLVAPYKELRENLKQELGDLIVEFYIHTTDIRGREHFHTDEYEKPTENYVDIDTTNVDPQISLNQIIEHISK
jgi:adenylylsulfate kinase-like enzyme